MDIKEELQLAFQKRLAKEGKAIVLCFWTVVAALVLAAIAVYIKSSLPNFIDAVSAWEDGRRVKMLHVALDVCADSKKQCVGGFINYRFNSSVVRISDCGKTCGKYETDIEEMRYYFKQAPAYMEEEIYSISLPGYKGWNNSAIRYA